MPIRPLLPDQSMEWLVDGIEKISYFQVVGFFNKLFFINHLYLPRASWNSILFAQRLRIFSAKLLTKESWILADLDAASKVEKSTYAPPPPPPAAHKELTIGDFSRFGLIQLERLARDHLELQMWAPRLLNVLRIRLEKRSFELQLKLIKRSRTND